MKAILITGASGLVGSELSEGLLKKGIEVRGLSRNPKRLPPGIKGFYWDPESGEMDHSALKGISSLVHLAGENIAEGRWTEKRKKEIIESRTRSCDVLASALSQQAAEGESLPESIILASAIGYYGSRGDELLDEASEPGEGFLAETTLAWEEAGQFPEKMRQVRLRIGVVLSRKGGALNEMERPLKLFAGAVPGSGRQYLSWIHHSDLVSIIQFAIENSSVEGVYNAVAPDPRTMDSFMRALGKEVGRPVYLPNVPGFVLKMMLGEMSEMVLGGARISSARIEEAGFHFKFGNLENALKALYRD
ncbi:MAG: TIGR01777 family oxidoreductase [Leptospiraceae bacterium]|nr:TIGR01777 family oxidoreductase [Leptospiraceae bacterium]